jgi:hypothetical protein
MDAVYLFGDYVLRGGHGFLVMLFGEHSDPLGPLGQFIRLFWVWVVNLRLFLER